MTRSEEIALIHDIGEIKGILKGSNGGGLERETHSQWQAIDEIKKTMLTRGECTTLQNKSTTSRRWIMTTIVAVVAIFLSAGFTIVSLV